MNPVNKVAKHIAAKVVHRMKFDVDDLDSLRQGKERVDQLIVISYILLSFYFVYVCVYNVGTYKDAIIIDFTISILFLVHRINFYMHDHVKQEKDRIDGHFALRHKKKPFHIHIVEYTLRDVHNFYERHFIKKQNEYTRFLIDARDLFPKVLVQEVSHYLLHTQRPFETMGIYTQTECVSIYGS